MKPTCLFFALVVLSICNARAALDLSVRQGRLYNGATPLNLVCLDPSLGLLAEARLVNSSGVVIEEGFDYGGFFRKCRENRINSTRQFLFYHWANALVPLEGLPRSQDDQDRRGRHSMRINDRHFNHIRAVIAEADLNSIAIVISLFDGVALETGRDDPKLNRWVNFPLNRRNNRSRGLVDSTQYFSAEFRPLLKEIVDATITAIGGHRNVILEIMNEPISNAGLPSASADATITQFHMDIAAHLERRFNGRGFRSPIMVNPSRGSDMPRLLGWAATASSVDIIDIHVTATETPASLNTLELWRRTSRKALVISLDGHASSGSTDRSFVEGTVAAFLAEAAAARRIAGPGAIGADFLVNAFLGRTQGSQDYDPRLANGWDGLWATFRRMTP